MTDVMQMGTFKNDTVIPQETIDKVRAMSDWQLAEEYARISVCVSQNDHEVGFYSSPMWKYYGFVHDTVKERFLER